MKMASSSKRQFPIVYDREERIRCFHVDCCDGLLWKGGTWEPGGEYVKKLVVKNVSNDTLKMKYKIPDTKFFSMDFPEWKRLSPGMSMTVEVIFRPIKFEPYDDFVEFVIKRQKHVESFFISVGATLSNLSAEIPDHLDFGFCPTNETTEKTFEIVNTGEIPAPFNWQVPAPFKIIPANGVIPTGKNNKITLTAQITPVDASVFVSKATCIVTGLKQGPFTFKMSAIGKYPFISISDNKVDFGKRIAGNRGIVDKEIVLRNQSLVDASFLVKQVESDRVPAFSFYPGSGVVKPRGELRFRVRYSPTCSGIYSCDHFDIITPGGNSLRVQCSGSCIGPNISISNKVPVNKDLGSNREDHDNVFIQFGDTPLIKRSSIDKTIYDSLPTRVLHLKNNTEEKVQFSFIVDPNSEFKFLDPAQGVIPPGLEKSIRIKFCPELVGNYYRKIFCLIKDQMPKVIQLIGTCFDAQDKKGNRPQPLLYRHIEAHRRRELVGYGLYSPDHILAIVQNGKDKSFAEDVVIPEKLTTSSRSGGSTLGELERFRQFFEEVTDSSKPIYVSEATIDFGAGSRLRVLEKKILHVTNNTETKVTCAWNTSWPMNVQALTEKPFQIFPETADIAPGKTTEFRVAFQPTQDNLYYNVEANAIVYCKSNRTFRLVKDEAFIPPWNLTVGLVGHTFPPGSEQFLPSVKFHINHPSLISIQGEESTTCTNSSSSLGLNFHKIEFPTCHEGEAVYQTIVLENIGDTPAKFQFSKDPAGVFSIKPDSGLIGRNEFITVALECRPPTRNAKNSSTILTPNIENDSNPLKVKYLLECVLNNSSEFMHTIELTGYRDVPNVTLHEPGVYEKNKISNIMYIKPTCVGLTTKRQYLLKNQSRVPLDFQWSIPKRLRKAISVTPKYGSLLGNESMLLSWQFTPQEVQKYTMDIPLSYKSLGTKKMHRRPFTILAQGSESKVNIYPSHIQLGAILVGTETTSKMFISNQSDCDVSFSLGISKISRTNALGEESNDEKFFEKDSVLKFSESTGVVEARSEKQISVTFQPIYCHQYEFSVFCNIGNSTSDTPDLESILVGEVLTAVIFGASAYPTVKVEDARCTNISTNFLWKQFDLYQFNKMIQRPLTVEEIRFAKSTGVRTNSLILEKDPLDSLDFNFTPALLESPSQTIMLQIRNTGHLPVEFTFRFPNDSDIELEPWADEGEPTASDLLINSILDADLFEIQPRKGFMSANEAVTLRFTYRYKTLDYEGQHELPIILKLKNGKQLRITLRGTTLPIDRPFIFIPNPVFTLEAVPIGTTHPPIQTYTLVNPSANAVEYCIDEISINKLCVDNFGFPILKCLDPKGYIHGLGGAAIIRWIFQPLEEKEYRCTVKVNMLGTNSAGDSNSVNMNIIARGYHPRNEVLESDLREKGRNLWQQPIRQLIPLSNQSASLSTDWIDFGLVPEGSIIRRISIIRNQTTAPLAFQWDRAHPLVQSGYLKISPSIGEIDPGSFVTCKFTFLQSVDSTCQSGSRAQIVETDIFCSIGSLKGMSEEKRGVFFNRLKRAVSRASTTREFLVSSTPSMRRTSVVERSTLSRDHRLSQQLMYNNYQAGIVNTPQNGPSAPIMPPITPLGNIGTTPINVTPTASNFNRMESTQSITSSVSAFTCNESAHPADCLNPDFAQNCEKIQLIFAHITARSFPILTTNTKYALDTTENFIPQEENGEVRKLIEGKDQYEVGFSKTGKINEDEIEIEAFVRDAINDKRVEEVVNNLKEESTPLFIDILHKKCGNDFEVEDESLLTLAASRATKLRKQRYGRELIVLPEVQNRIENIIENTVFNLIQETLHGDVQLKNTKQIFRLRSDLLSKSQ